MAFGNNPTTQGLEQPGVVEGGPVQGRGVGIKFILMSPPTQTILWLHEAYFKKQILK